MPADRVQGQRPAGLVVDVRVRLQRLPGLVQGLAVAALLHSDHGESVVHVALAGPVAALGVDAQRAPHDAREHRRSRRAGR